MVFSRYIWTVLLLVVSIVATSVFLGIYLQKPGYPVTRSMLIAALALESIGLIYYLIRIRSDLLKLVHALRNEDPTLQFSREGKDPYFSAIHKGFNEIIRNFRLVRLDREAEHQFLLSMVEHIQFGIIAMDDQGAVKIANRSFLELFGLKSISAIDELEETSPGLPQIIHQLQPQEESLKQIRIGGETRHLIFLSSRYRLRNQQISMISMRDISREIDRNELEAWQKLLRVLRHEILNSITPIRLITHNLSETLHPGDKVNHPKELTSEQTDEVRTGLETIHRRASGLSRFLDAYSNLYRIPEIHPQTVAVGALLHRVFSLFREQLGTKVENEVIHLADRDMVIQMDERMIEQVLINLLKNSIEATSGKEKPQVRIVAETRAGNPLISVTDNGDGIREEDLENIFVPFYSTKQGGTGIGLSFSQHVMRLHHGQLKVNSKHGSGCEVQLLFPKNR
jgi:nitrogen fixation/metabolism regulation signal transduction histidine kinase